jgi:hypothetical protein
MSDVTTLEVRCGTKHQTTTVSSATADPTHCPLCSKPKRSLAHPLGCAFTVKVLPPSGDCCGSGGCGDDDDGGCGGGCGC